jgi:hypothetical protein
MPGPFCPSLAQFGLSIAFPGHFPTGTKPPLGLSRSYRPWRLADTDIIPPYLQRLNDLNRRPLIPVTVPIQGRNRLSCRPGRCRGDLVVFVNCGLQVCRRRLGGLQTQILPPRSLSADYSGIIPESRVSTMGNYTIVTKLATNLLYGHLSTLTRLERLSLEFESPLPRPVRGSRRLSPPARSVLSVLRNFRLIFSVASYSTPHNLPSSSLAHQSSKHLMKHW